MRSEKWKVISIKDTSFQKIRENLRIILELSFHARLEYLRKLRRLHREKRIAGKQTNSQWKREVILSNKINDLLQAQVNSILRCSMGSACKSLESKRFSMDRASLNMDMVWNPLSRNWICIDCYIFFFYSQQEKDLLYKIIKTEKNGAKEIINNMKKINL